MKYNTGDNVFIKKNLNKKFKIVEVFDNSSITSNQVFFNDWLYCIDIANNGRIRKWYKEDDLLSFKEYRKLKLQKLNEMNER